MKLDEYYMAMSVFWSVLYGEFKTNIQEPESLSGVLLVRLTQECK